MPATLVAPHVVSATSATSAVLVEDLSNGERKVALYASDMPTGFRFRRGDDARVTAWIIQGATRLGLDELFRSAAYAAGYRLLWLAHLDTPEQAQAHARRFPNATRLDRAEQVASAFLLAHRVAPAARARGLQTMVEGACRCHGTGWIDVYHDDPDANCSMSCPGHNPQAVRDFYPVRKAVAA
ncbi:hypothetical protein JBE04_20810 [Streptomyces sp. PRKS01-29]|nr:hypothetical protein [Streptomyces sabulosicollis]MBI0296834.1 hypothetical protein [Streptomyces sabulosicollis]